jgi:hypothetical protein
MLFQPAASTPNAINTSVASWSRPIVLCQSRDFYFVVPWLKHGPTIWATYQIGYVVLFTPDYIRLPCYLLRAQTVQFSLLRGRLEHCLISIQCHLR